MKNIFLPLLVLVFLFSCEKQNSSDFEPNQDILENESATTRGPGAKIKVCHYQEATDTWKVLNLNENAWHGHEGHGDVLLVDEDGDGYVTLENGCGIPVDCDDTDASLTDDCGTSCLPGEIEMDPNDPLLALLDSTIKVPTYVAPANEPGVYTWQEANDACAAKAAADQCEWYLPNYIELDAIRAILGPNGGSGAVNGGSFWSSEEIGDFNLGGWILIEANNSGSGYDSKEIQRNCLCVRK